MKKTVYELPSVRILEVRVEGIINDSTRSSSAPANIAAANILGGEEGEEW